MSLSEFGLEPSFLSVIVSQAAIILIACSVLLGVVKDLYEVQEFNAAPPRQRRITRVRPVLTGKCADRLRFFVRAFAMFLPVFYLMLGVLILLVEKGTVIEEGGKKIKHGIIRSPFLQWDKSLVFDLQEVYFLELIVHFLIVFVVALIFYWTVSVRREVSNQRLRQQPA